VRWVQLSDILGTGLHLSAKTLPGHLACLPCCHGCNLWRWWTTVFWKPLFFAHLESVRLWV